MLELLTQNLDLNLTEFLINQTEPKSGQNMSVLRCTKLAKAYTDTNTDVPAAEGTVGQQGVESKI